MLPCDCIVLQARKCGGLHSHTFKERHSATIALLLYLSSCHFHTRSLLLRLPFSLFFPLSSFPFLLKLTCGNSLKTPQRKNFSVSRSVLHPNTLSQRDTSVGSLPHPLHAALVRDGQQVDRRNVEQVKVNLKRWKNKEIMKED